VEQVVEAVICRGDRVVLAGATGPAEAFRLIQEPGQSLTPRSGLPQSLLAG
jgi:hypothetical protein